MLISVNQPANVLVFFGGLMNLVNFQLLDTSNLYNKMFHLDPDSAGNDHLNSQFDLMGYGSLYIVQNFGIMCITLLMPFIARVLTSIIVFLLIGLTKMLCLDLTQIKVKS